MQISIRALADVLNLQEGKKPLIHCISNLVGIKDLAEGISCYSGRTIIVNGGENISNITNKANGLLISLENLNNRVIEVMEKSLRVASRNGIPIMLDIVGINTSFFRREVAIRFLTRYKIDVIKGGLLEFQDLIDKESNITEVDFKGYKLRDNFKIREEIRKLSKRFKAIIVLSEEEYYVTDGFSEFFLDNSSKSFNKVLGSDVILTGLIAVGIAIAKNNAEMVKGILVAVMTMAVSERLTLEKNETIINKMSLKDYLLYEISCINKEKIYKLGKVKYEFTR